MEIKNLSKTFQTKYGELAVIDNINLDVYEGEIIAIVGPSGGGKTTILNIIANLIKPTSGEVQINGKIGYMFQKDHLFEWRSVNRNILLSKEIVHDKDPEIQKTIDELLKKYDLIDFKNSVPSELSGGMRQRIALIRTIISKPSILLLDEAFSALDYQTRINVTTDVYKTIKASKISAILVTHDISEAISIADRVIVLTKRPAKIKNIYQISYANIRNPDPLKVRSQPEFAKYFNQIWADLNE